jgi:hypothetical protein
VDDSRTSYPPPTEFSFEFKLEQTDYLKGEEAARFSLTNSALLGNLTLLAAIFMFLGIHSVHSGDPVPSRKAIFVEAPCPAPMAKHARQCRSVSSIGQ